MIHTRQANNLLNDYYNHPKMSYSEMGLYYSFSTAEDSLISSLRSTSNKLMVMLLLGYVKKYNRILLFSELQKLSLDVRYLQKSYFPEEDININYNRSNYSNYVPHILALLSLRVHREINIKELKVILRRVCTSDSSARKLTKEAIRYYLNSGLVFPKSASVLKEIVQEAIDDYFKKVILRYKKHLNRPKVVKEINDWVETYQISLNKEPSNNSISEAKDICLSKKALDKFIGPYDNIIVESNKNIQNFADLYDTGESTNDKTINILIILCAVKSRIMNMNDYLLEMFFIVLNKLATDSEMDYHREVLNYFKAVQPYLTKMAEMSSTLISDDIEDTDPVKGLRDNVYNSIARDEIDHVIDLFRNAPKKDKTVSAKEKLKLLQVILISLKLESKKYPNLINISPDENNHLKHYKKIGLKIKSGHIYQNRSRSYKSLESDIISTKVWKDVKRNRDFEEVEPVAHLETLKIELEDLYEQMSEKEYQRGNTEYPKVPKSLVLNNIFDSLSQTPISEVLQLVLEETEFNKEFKHLKSKKRHAGDKLIAISSIIALGTNLGAFKMSHISNFTYDQLSYFIGTYLSIENLKSANDLIVEKLKKLRIYKYFHIDSGIVYSSSDGQKFETQLDNISARYSQKYFGLAKGVSNYSLIANHIPISAKVISANEYEGHHIIDILLNNQTSINPDVHSADSHGVSNLNFGLLNLLGYQFAPRIKGAGIKKFDLYGFRSLRSYTKQKIRPSKKVNEKVIIENWDSILRVVYSLKRGDVSQSALIKKLASKSDSDPLKKSLWEYNAIIRSIFVLNYALNPTLKQNIQKSLNRGENYHQLKRAIAYANSGRLKGSSPKDQQLWSEAARLIANSVIYYNSKILSHLYSYTYENHDAELREKVIKSSPVSWSHINFMGKYDFYNLDDVDTWIEKLDFKTLIKEL